MIPAALAAPARRGRLAHLIDSAARFRPAGQVFQEMRSVSQLRTVKSHEAADVVVAGAPIIGLQFQEIGAMLDRTIAVNFAGPRAHDVDCAVPSAVRHYLTDREGEGYHDFIKLSDHLVLSITHARYRNFGWVEVSGRRFFKLRLLLSGTLRDRSKQLTISGPQAHVDVCPEGSGGYWVSPGHETKMVVLHCSAEFLSPVMNLRESQIPQPLHNLFDPAGQAVMFHRVRFSPTLVAAANNAIDSRFSIRSHLRRQYLGALAHEIICEVVSELSNSQALSQARVRLTSREMNCLYEARDYLSLYYATPPTIAELARKIGMSRTKLKAGFKELLGQTIYQYVLDCRMARAAQLLADGNRSVQEVSYSVGYEYPANFTCAFKRYFGYLPRAWRQPS